MNRPEYGDNDRDVSGQFMNDDVQPHRSLRADDQVIQMDGVGSKRAGVFESNGVRSVRQLAASHPRRLDGEGVLGQLLMVRLWRRAQIVVNRESNVPPYAFSKP